MIKSYWKRPSHEISAGVFEWEVVNGMILCTRDVWIIGGRLACRKGERYRVKFSSNKKRELVIQTLVGECSFTDMCAPFHFRHIGKFEVKCLDGCSDRFTKGNMYKVAHSCVDNPTMFHTDYDDMSEHTGVISLINNHGKKDIVFGDNATNESIKESFGIIICKKP